MRNALYRMQGSVCRVLGGFVFEQCLFLRPGSADVDRVSSVQDSKTFGAQETRGSHGI